MSDSPNIDDVLSRQHAERQKREEKERQDEETEQRYRELDEAFHRVRFCTIGTLPPDTDFYEEFARRLIELVRLLSQRGELERLLVRVSDISGIVSEDESDARVYIVHLLGVTERGDQMEVARRVREAAGLPFWDRVNEWLRRGLEQTFYGYYSLTDNVDGVCWPVLTPNDPDPVDTLLQACGCVANAFEQKDAGPFGSPNPAKVVKRLWHLVNRVAEDLCRMPPDLPDQVLDAEAVRQAVLEIRNWCHKIEANPFDPVEAMKKAIRDRRVILQLMCNASSSGFNWQKGIDQLWQRWRDLFPLEPPPERPTGCCTYHQASDAVDALVRAFSDLDEPWKTMSDTPFPAPAPTVQARLVSRQVLIFG